MLVRDSIIAHTQPRVRTMDDYYTCTYRPIIEVWVGGRVEHNRVIKSIRIVPSAVSANGPDIESCCTRTRTTVYIIYRVNIVYAEGKQIYIVANFPRVICSEWLWGECWAPLGGSSGNNTV